LNNSTSIASNIGTTTHQITGVHSDLLKREVKVDVFLPPGYSKESGPYRLILLNDGQDARAVNLEATLNALHADSLMNQYIVVGVHAGERLQEFGVSGKPDYRKRGNRARRYEEFIIDQLIPWLNHEYHIDVDGGKNVIAGWSLGGLSAISIAWNNPGVFGKVGGFSGAFWWRKRALDKGYTDKDRIMHSVIRKSRVRKGMKFWFQAGTEDETSDRNNNGIIDSIDDTLDLISELIILGYKPYHDVSYYEMLGGHHNCDTWSEALPEFLKWATRP
jgi:enterochelin esterase-like enzyme